MGLIMLTRKFSRRLLVSSFLCLIIRPTACADPTESGTIITTSTPIKSQSTPVANKVPGPTTVPSSIGTPHDSQTNGPKKEIKAKIVIPSLEISLGKENLRLNLTADETSLRFTVIVKNAGGQSIIDGVKISESKRLFLGLETDHFNVDVVALPFTNDSGGVVGFGNRIEDLAWNKRNGVLLPDIKQNYKWVAAGGNGSTFFTTFERNWMTCDKQDIQFGVSDIKIWWLIDDTSNGTLKTGSKGISNRMVQMLDKQKIGEETISNSQTSTSIPTSNQKNRTSVNQSTNDTNGPEEVEILKSIQESNFKGPFMASFPDMLKNVSLIFLQVCEQSNIIFRCNASELKSLRKLNTTITQGLAIWKVNFQMPYSGRKSNEHQIEPCQSILDYANSPNQRIFNALFGSRSLKGGGQTTTFRVTTDVTVKLIILQLVLHILRQT